MNYLQKIVTETEDYFNVDNVDISMLANKLSENMNNKLYYNPNPLNINNGIIISGDYSTKNLRQSFYKKCKFQNCNLSETGLAGSLFSETIFFEADYTNTNFQSCDFRNCLFENSSNGIRNTRFSQ